MPIELNPDLELAYFGRGLSRNELEELRGQVVHTGQLQNDLITLNPTVLSMRFPPTGASASIPNAAVCLQDMAWALGEAEYALLQALIALTLYRKHDPIEFVAVSQAAFYLSDVALRLYSAGEHVSAGILLMLGATDQDLQSAGDKRTSRQSKLAKFLRRNWPTHALTVAGEILRRCPEWFKTIEYRGQWVHAQPPTMAGIGIVHNRRESRWELVEGPGGRAVAMISIGGGDRPSTTVDQVLHDAQSALRCFEEYARAVVDHYFELLKEHGLKIDLAKGETTLSLFETPGVGISSGG